MGKPFSDEQLKLDPVLAYFRVGDFCALAHIVLATRERTAERTLTLRKLLEAEDSYLRDHV